MISRILNSMSNYEGGMMQNVSAMGKDDEEALKAQQANVSNQQHNIVSVFPL